LRKQEIDVRRARIPGCILKVTARTGTMPGQKGRLPSAGTGKLHGKARLVGSAHVSGPICLTRLS
jgi:hypothetical protein